LSIELHAVQRVRWTEESTFGSDMSASIASFFDLPIREGTAQMTLTTTSLDPMPLQQSRLDRAEEVLGPRSATLTFTLNLSSVAPANLTAGWAMALLENVFGGVWEGISTTFTGGTAAVPTVTSASGFLAGAAIGWVNSSGNLEVREIESISGTSITLKHAFSGAPSNAQTAYAGTTFYPTENPSTSLQFLVEGAESDDRWLLLGGQAVGGVSIAVDVTGQQLPSITVNMKFADWLASDETSSSITGTLGTATYLDFNPMVGHAGELRVFTVGTSTLSTSSLVHCSALAFNPAVNYVPVTSPSGVETVLRWRAGRTNPAIEGSFTTYYDGMTWFNARKNRGDYAFLYRMGNAAGETVVLSAPTVQIVNPQRVADASQLAAQTIQWKGRRDTDVGVSTTELARAPWRLHCL